MPQIVQTFGRSIRGKCAIVFLTVGGLWSSTCAYAQTNTPSGVSGTITSAVGSAYDIAVGIGVATMAIGAVVFFVRKGLKARM